MTDRIEPDRDLDRIRWNCRRGLLELDLLLERFLQQHLHTLDEEQMDVFKELLVYADNDLLDMVMERADPVNTQLCGVLQMMRNA